MPLPGSVSKGRVSGCGGLGVQWQAWTYSLGFSLSHWTGLPVFFAEGPE